MLDSQANSITVLFKKEEISVTECLAIMSKIGEIEDIKIKEPDMEEAVENFLP